MDFIKRNVLIRHRDLIIKDLHGDVVDSLKDKGVLTSADYDVINSLSEQNERNEKLLDILYTKPRGFHPFLDSLKEWYWWIEKKLRDALTERPLTLDDAIALSNIPAIPRINVSRTDLLNRVRKELMELKKGSYVVLHGMSGCGKSSLAAEALHHPLILGSFKGKVIWLSCGHDIKDENEILSLLMELNAWICDEELVKTASIKTWKATLKKRFSNSDFQDGLVVLDDVNSPLVIEALQIGCKTLVTTNNIDIMDPQGSRFVSIQVSESFKEEETMEYFAKSVHLSVDKLPPQAAMIHRHGKGHPLIMSLIGAQLADHLEESNCNTVNWQDWLDVLVRREYGDLKRRSLPEDPFPTKTIEQCINNLTPSMREKYLDFALFVEDVNIKIEVLEVLWDLPKFKVKQIMFELYSKSLLVRRLNLTEQFIVYGIHDLLRFYLRNQLDEDALKNLHLKLINRYMAVSNEEVSRLPKDDNYFFYYIGYHIANSKKYNLFQKWYFNLEFIEAKMKVAGPGDLLLDYKRYSSHFTDGMYDPSSVTKCLLDFIQFVETSGLDVRRNSGPDIVQLALQGPHDSHVYRKALELVQSRPQKTYLRFKLGPSKSRSPPDTIQAREKISAACFSNNENDFIVAFESGTIQTMNKKGYKLREYEGHSGAVTRLNLCSVKNIFLSVALNCVKIWQLPDLDFEVSLGCGDRSPSPSQRQRDFTDLFNYRSPDKRKSWFTITCKKAIQTATFSADGLKLVICCADENRVEVWHCKVKEWSCFSRTHITKPSCAIFSADDQFVVIGTSTSHLLVHCINGNLRFKLILSYPILSLFPLPDDDQDFKFGVLTISSLSVWNLEKDQPDKNVNRPVPCLRDYNKGDGEKYASCAASADGNVVAVATSSSKILVCDLVDGSAIREIEESTGNIKYLAMDESKDHRLMACYDDAIVRVWKLGEVFTRRSTTLRNNFVVTWTPENKFVLVAATYKSCVKKITNITDSEDLAVQVDGDINICGISKSGKLVVVGSSCQEVFLQRGQSMVKILKVHESIGKLSVEKIEDRIYVVVGLVRSVKVWKCKAETASYEETELPSDSSEKAFEFHLHDKLVDSFILPSEKLVTISSNGTIKEWCMKAGKFVKVLFHGRLRGVEICATDLSCGNILVTLDTSRHLMNLYDLEEAPCLEQSVALEEGKPCCCSFSVDGKKLVIGFANGLIQVRDMDSKQSRQISTGGEKVQCVCVSRTGIVGASTSSRVLLVPSAGPVGQARLRVHRVVMSPDDSTILTVDSDGHLHLIDQFRTPNSSSNSIASSSHSFTNIATIP